MPIYQQEAEVQRKSASSLSNSVTQAVHGRAGLEAVTDFNYLAKLTAVVHNYSRTMLSNL